MSYLSKVIPLVRARSSSPIIFPITNNAGNSARRGARTPPLRSMSAPLTDIFDHGSVSVGSSTTRGYSTAFAGLQVDGGLGGINNSTLSGWGSKQAVLHRSMSDVSVPEPPTSNHPHKPIPGATGKLIYTET